MLITTLLVAGSAVYVGVKTAATSWRCKPTQQAQHAQTSPSSVIAVTVVGRTNAANGSINDTDDDPGKAEERSKARLSERRYRAVAATSVWLTLGGILFPPLTIMSIPLTVYSTVPILESGYRSLFGEGRIRPSVINSALIASTLLTDRYLPAAALTWLHHAVRHMSLQIQEVVDLAKSEVTSDLSDLASQVMGNSPRTVWKVNENVEIQTPFAELQIGDVIVSSRGEFIPVEGIVTAGEATVSMVLRSGVSTPVPVVEGDRVYARSFVTEGRIRIKIEQFINKPHA
jgi:cation transport ATPase